MLPTTRNQACAALPALLAHLAHRGDFNLPHLPAFRQHTPTLSQPEVAEVAKLLSYSWATEYALRANVEVSGHHAEALRLTMAWAVPQARMVVRTSLRALLRTLGVHSNNGRLILREAGRLVVKNTYPRALSFYAAGAYGDFSVRRLPLAGYTAGEHVAKEEILTQARIADSLRAVRKAIAHRVRAEVQENPNTAIRSQKDGKPLDKWKAEHWQQITWRLGYTTVFDVLDLALAPFDSPEQADHYAQGVADPAAWYTTVLGVLTALATVHESYVAKAIGADAYRDLINNLPAHLQDGFVLERADAILQTIVA